MEKLSFDDFMKGVDPFVEGFAAEMHRFLSERSFVVEVKPAAQGPVVSYKAPKTKKTVLNYVHRKGGIQVRIYADYLHAYPEFFNSLPKCLTQLVDKATDCRQCNVRCPKGYRVNICGADLNKCRYGAFLFPLNPDTAEAIKAFIENEVAARINLK